MLLKNLRRLAQLNPAVVSVVEHGPDVSYVEREDTGPSEVQADIVEGDTTRLQAVPVAPTPSGFGAFLNAIQRAQVRAYFNGVPLVHASVSAAVRQRVDRAMRPHPLQLLIEKQALFVPFQLLDPSTLIESGIDAADLMDTTPATGERLPLFPPVLYARAAEAVGRWREQIEREVAERWCTRQSDEWLLVDGTLTLSRKLASSPRAVGVVKNHRTRFFDGASARTLLSLSRGQRTTVFAPRARSWSPVHSWYLRLRDSAGRDVFWGLVRVEACASSDPGRTADRISSWLLAEVAPATLPDARWDRLLYPVRECEQFLRARVVDN